MSKFITYALFVFLFAQSSLSQNKAIADDSFGIGSFTDSYNSERAYQDQKRQRELENALLERKVAIEEENARQALKQIQSNNKKHVKCISSKGPNGTVTTDCYTDP